MSTFQIVATRQVPVAESTAQAHITHVRVTRNDPEHTKTLAEVIRDMESGDSFYTIGASSGVRAAVERYACAGCGKTFIRTSADASRDNNLDSLPRF